MFQILFLFLSNMIFRDEEIFLSTELEYRVSFDNSSGFRNVFRISFPLFFNISIWKVVCSPWRQQFPRCSGVAVSSL